MECPFGARLRQHRERQGIALATIAAATKIKESLLEGLERGNLSQWPSGLFRRAWVRSYAQAIGLDAAETLREFLDVHPEPVEPVGPPPPSGLRGLVESAIGTLARRRTDSSQPPAAPPIEPARIRPSCETPAAPPAAPAPTKAPGEVDLGAAARVCTDLGRTASASQVEPLLREAARILDAQGAIVWVWDAMAAQLRPALAHGYSKRLVAQLPGVPRDADNLTAAAFRSAQTVAVSGDGHSSGALVVPLLTPGACAGVLAIELRLGTTLCESNRAIATIFAAMLAQLFSTAAEPAAAPHELGAGHQYSPITEKASFANSFHARV